MDGHCHINTAHHERLPKKKVDVVLATKGQPERRSAPFITVNGQICSYSFKRRPAFSFTVIILDFLLISKTFYYYSTGVYSHFIIKVIKNYMCCYAFLSDESLFT